jgi:hypothetical protein
MGPFMHIRGGGVAIQNVECAGQMLLVSSAVEIERVEQVYDQLILSNYIALRAEPSP